jgi:hypothetical protein
LLKILTVPKKYERNQNISAIIFGLAAKKKNFKAENIKELRQ